MQLSALPTTDSDNSADIAQSDGKLTVRVADIRFWLENKLINKTQAVYFGLRVLYPRATANIHVDEFCEILEITEDDFNKAIADLTKKKVLHKATPERYVQLNLFEKQETDQI